MIPTGKLVYIMEKVTPRSYDEFCFDKNEIDALRFVAREQKKVLLACKQFFEQLQEKGIALSFTERTATSLLIEKIKGLE